jgi:hypothetical protein
LAGDVIHATCAPYLHHGRPIRRTERTVNSDFSIIAQYQAEFRGIAGYYQLATAPPEHTTPITLDYITIYSLYDRTLRASGETSQTVDRARPACCHRGRAG